MTSLMEALQTRFKRPFRFVVVGLVNTAVGLGIIYGCKYFLDMNNVLANILGYAVGVTVSFVLNSSWTFEYRGPMLVAAARFLVVFLISYLVNLATVMGLIHLAEVNSYVAHAAGMPVYTVCFYLLSRFYAFRPLP